MKEIPVKNLPLFLGYFFLIAYALILYQTAWLSDDSYITLRSVDNFVNGLGPVWNPSERVQVFTHPLWYLILSTVYFFTRDAFFTTIAISLAISLLSFSLLIFSSPIRSAPWAITLMIPLVSNAYIDYSTSGLENPLTHLFIIGFLFFYFQDKPNIKALGIIAGLATFNRIDSLLLFIPALIWLFAQSPTKEVSFFLLIGFIPFFVWEIFSIFYYGFPLPNTAYAKLNSAIPYQELIHQGSRYFLNSLRVDPITLTTIATSIFLTFKLRATKAISLAFGAIIYLFYILWIGGDFMSGRFFSAPLLMSVLLLRNHMEKVPLKPGVPLRIFLFIIFLECWSLTTNPSFLTIQNRESFTLIDSYGIADEQAVFVSEAGLAGAQWDQIQPRSTLAYRGMELQKQGTQVITELNIGYLGFFAGPKIRIIDQYALTDPLLARIPFSQPEWRPGHFFRPLPKGYLETVIQDRNIISSPALAEYYDALQLVTQGDLFNRNRLIAIWKFNTGQYDYLMEKYTR